MSKTHLTSEELTAARDENPADPATIQHLASCPECQRALDDIRWTAVLARSAEPHEPDEHPDNDEIRAYRENALTADRSRRVERHIGNCDRCLVVFNRLREIDRAAGYDSPPAALLGRVKQQIAKGPGLLQLGRLILTRVGEGLNLTLQPLPVAAADRLRLSGGMAPRRQRARSFDELAEDPQSGKDFFDHSTFSDAVPAALGSPQPAVSKIDAGPFDLRVEALQQKGKVVIDVRIREKKTARPCPKISLQVEYAGGKRHYAKTDRAGRASLKLPGGASRLTVESEPALRLELHNRG